MSESRPIDINSEPEDMLSQSVLFSLRSNVLLYELPGLGSAVPGQFLLIDLVTGQHFGLSNEQAAIIRTLQVLQETVSFGDVSEACRQKFGVSVDCSAIHALLKDLDDLALIK
ncbi:MAG TPA: hypothetical protein VN604_07605, partial [Nitrospirota bacterium]|nr:hypothetical protein [Nitrospirota bacterium]